MYIEELEQVLGKIQQTEEQLKLLKIELKYIPFLISKKNLSYDENLKIAEYLYWADVGISANDIAEIIMRMKLHKFLKLIPKEFPNIICSNCLKPIIIKSLQAKKEFTVKKYFNNKICDTCLNKRSEERDVEYKNQALKRKELLFNLKSMPYKEYLESDHWKQTRDYQLKRAKFRCQLCNLSGKLNVHHRTYERRGEELNSDLIVLCESCHKLHHNK